MDIFEWAEQYNWACDYHDMNTGKIYACTQYRNDPLLPGIPIYQDGRLIGFAKKKETE